MNAQMLLQYFASSASANITGVALKVPGGGGGTWAYVDASGNTVSRNSTYFNTHPVFGGIQDVMIDGQYMVKIPKFYYKRGFISGGANNGAEAWWISDQPAPGFSVHPAFMSGGAEINQVYVGKYQASYNGKLQSIPGVIPQSLTYASALTYAEARNVSGVTGFYIWNAYIWAAIQMLYVCENATMDCQTKTGIGRLGASYVETVDAADVAQATYRGMVGLWGNIRQFISGLKIRNGAVWVFDRGGNKTWTATSYGPYTLTDIYPIDFATNSGSGFDMRDLFLATYNQYQNNPSIATAPDRQSFVNPSDGIYYYPAVGGSFSSTGGLWDIYCQVTTDTYSSPYGEYGTRLAKI